MPLRGFSDVWLDYRLAGALHHALVESYDRLTPSWEEVYRTLESCSTFPSSSSSSLQAGLILRFSCIIPIKRLNDSTCFLLYFLHTNQFQRTFGHSHNSKRRPTCTETTVSSTALTPVQVLKLATCARSPLPALVPSAASPQSAYAPDPGDLQAMLARLAATTGTAVPKGRIRTRRVLQLTYSNAARRWRNVQGPVLPPACAGRAPHLTTSVTRPCEPRHLLHQEETVLRRRIALQ